MSDENALDCADGYCGAALELRGVVSGGGEGGVRGAVVVKECTCCCVPSPQSNSHCCPCASATQEAETLRRVVGTALMNRN